MAAKLKRPVLILCALLGIVAVFVALAPLQKPSAQEAAFAGNKVTHLITIDLTGVANRQVIANIYEVPAGGTVPRHWHHGDEFHLVLAGEWAAEVQDRPVRALKAGDSQYVAREHWHGGKVVSETPLKLLGVMIVEKDQPITELVK
jgi:quercetin dioxygenase-like cupin family protein